MAMMNQNDVTDLNLNQEPEEKVLRDEEYDEEQEDEQIDSGSKTKDSLFSQMSKEGRSMDTKNIFEQMLLKDQENYNRNQSEIEEK